MAKEFIGSTCPSCGEEALRHHEKKLSCDKCGFERALAEEAYRITSRPLSSGGGVFWERLEVGLERNGKDMRCESCGGELNMDKSLSDFNCPFCLATSAAEGSGSKKVIKPWGLVPFNIPQRRAFEILSNWIEGDWIGKYLFYPRDFLNFAKLEHIQGVYIPYWAYKVTTQATWYVFAGYKATEDQKEWKEEDLRWVPKSIYFEHTFDEVLIPASKGVKEKELGKVYDFDEKENYTDILNRVVPYEEAYLQEFICELYQMELKNGLEKVDEILDKKIKGFCMKKADEEGVQKQIPIDFKERPALSTAKDGLTFKHILLPVWIAVYKHKGKPMRFIVNGVNGNTYGYRPFDNRRFWILLAIIFVMIIILLLFVGSFWS